jgi:glycosyltransferase involved in cell wall biosynthesis
MLLEERKGRATNFAWKNRAWHRMYHQPMYNGSIKTAECGMVVSKEGKQYAERVGKAKAGRFRFVPNGVDEKFFAPREYPDKPSRGLLYVGSWIDRKGVFYLAEAFQLLVKSVSGVRLTVAGCFAPENVVKSFFAPEARDRVSVIPFVTRAEMPNLYAEHDVFVFPSLVEGMPLTLLEAMAAAMPVVTTNVCGMADGVEDGVNGVLVSPADAKSLAEAIEKLCASAELRKQLGAQAQDTMRRYTWDRVVDGVESVLLAASNAKAVSVSDARSPGAR